MTTTLLLPLLVAGLVGAVLYFVGLRKGERLGREHARSEVETIARAAAEQSNEQARAAYDQATNQAVQRLQETAESERELRQTDFDATAKPLRDQLEKVRELASKLDEKRSRDHGALQVVATRLASEVAAVKGSSDSLRQALKGDRQARGRWGEIQLENLIESAGLTAHCDFLAQAAIPGTNGNRSRPDVVVNLPGDAYLPVDSKAPMDDYLKATEMDTPELQDAAFADHAKKVRSHAEALGKKDYAGQNVGGPSFTVMFLPIESLLAEAMRFEPDLLQFAADKKVVLATPHTLMALLWTVRTLWRNETSTRNAEEMRNAGLELENRLNIFLDHLADVGSGLSSATKMYNKAVGSLEGRLHPQLRKLRELGGLPEEAPGKKVPASANEFPRPLRDQETDLPTERNLFA